MSEACVYLLRCTDWSLYTGWTIDLERRLARHRAVPRVGTRPAGCPSSSRSPYRCPTAPPRAAQEARIKRLPRADKLACCLRAVHATGTDDHGASEAGPRVVYRPSTATCARGVNKLFGAV